MKRILFKETDTPGIGKISKDLDEPIVKETRKYFDNRKDSELVEMIQEAEIIKLAIRTTFNSNEESEPIKREEAKQLCYDVKRDYEEKMMSLFSIPSMSIQGVKVNQDSIEFEIYFIFPYKQNSQQVEKEVVKESTQKLIEQLERISGKKVTFKEDEQTKLPKKEKLIILLEKYKIANYTINDDLTVDEDVRLSYLRLTKLPFKFGSVTGNFYCSGNQLTSLQGAPSSVTGNFDCGYNQLTSLQGGPSSVGGFFNCHDNRLTSLQGAPSSVTRSFDCSNNQLTSLQGAPSSVGGHFDCSYNQLTSLQGAPSSVTGDFDCSNNQLTSLQGAPRSVIGDFYCSNNQLTSLQGAPSVTGNFYCSNNQLTSLQGGPSSVTRYFNCSNNQLTSLQGAPSSVTRRFSCSGNPTLSKQVIDKYLQSINDSRIEEVDELTEEKSMFNINPKLAFRLYDILKVKFPEIAQEFTQSAFFTFLNENLNKTTLREDVNLEQQEIDDKLYVTGKEIETYLKSEFGSHNDEMNYEIEKWEDDKEETGQYISNDKVKFDKFIQDFSNKDLMRSEFVKYWNTMYPSAKEPLV